MLADFSDNEEFKCMKYNRGRNKANRYQDHAVTRTTTAVPVLASLRGNKDYLQASPKHPPVPLFKCQNGFRRKNGLDLTDTNTREVKYATNLSRFRRYSSIFFLSMVKVGCLGN